MLGQPVYFLTPDVVGVELKGRLNEGITATDLVLTVTEMLRKEKVVGKFVEFFGEGTASLAVPDRATIAQHGARIRRDDGLLPRRRRDHRLPHGHRPHGGRDRRVRVVLQGAGPLRHPARRRHRLHEGRDARPRVDQGVASRARSGRRTASSSAASRSSSPRSSRSRSPRTASRSRPKSSAAAIRRDRERPARRDQRRSAAASQRCPAPQRRRDGQQPADARSRGEPSGRVRRHRQRRRADRRDHVVHEHVEPRRAARRRPAREKGRRGGPHGQAAHQDVARARARASSPIT